MPACLSPGTAKPYDSLRDADPGFVRDPRLCGSHRVRHARRSRALETAPATTADTRAAVRVRGLPAPPVGRVLLTFV